MYKLRNAQHARDLQALALVAESLLSSVNSIPPEKFLEFRMRFDGYPDCRIKQIRDVELKIGNVPTLTVEYIYPDDANGVDATGYYYLWVDDQHRVTGDF
jgi:hypothetical protein